LATAGQDAGQPGLNAWIWAGRRDERCSASHPPSRDSGYAARMAPTSRPFGHGSENPRGFIVPVAREGREAARDHRRLLNCRCGMLLEVEAQPTSSHARVPLRLLLRDQQRQLERLVEGDPADFLRRRLGDQQVAALERPLEDGVGDGPARSTLLLPGAETARGESSAVD
jgi:hypothetical protein